MMLVWGLAGLQHKIMTHSKTADTIYVKLRRQRHFLLFLVCRRSSWVTESLPVVLWLSCKQPLLSRVFRLRWRVFDKALGCSSLPAQPSADQWDPQRERGPRCALGCYHRSHAGPQTPGPVFNGAPGGIKRERWSLWPLPDTIHTVAFCVCVFCYRESWRRSYFSSKTAIRIRKENLLKPQSRSQTSLKGYGIFGINCSHCSFARKLHVSVQWAALVTCHSLPLPYSKQLQLISSTCSGNLSSLHLLFVSTIITIVITEGIALCSQQGAPFALYRPLLHN